jgi:hypothetical protein
MICHVSTLFSCYFQHQVMQMKTVAREVKRMCGTMGLPRIWNGMQGRYHVGTKMTWMILKGQQQEIAAQLTGTSK